ncbi:hypothetical protein [Streptomyces tendae]|uniref:hypothetical protein n=1 Tax=Streptomyces tendae TaxID=1932 RepID=UPI00365F4AC5
MSTHQLAALARTAEPRLMLRRFLALDAVVTGANALAYLALSGPLGRYLGAGSGLLLALGAFLAVYAGCVGLLAARPRPPVPRGASFGSCRGARGLARTSAALSSVARAPPCRPPPPCSCTHQTPRGSVTRHRRPEPA